MNERTYYGNTGDLIITDVQYVDGFDETPSGTITCTFPGTLEGALAAAPELGTSSEHLPESTREELGTTVRVRLVLKNRTFSAGKDGSVNVVLKYGFREEDAGSSAAQSTEYRVTGSMNETSILLHPRYADVPEREKLLAKALVDGTKPYETVYLKKDELVIQTMVDSREKDKYTMLTLKDAIDKVVSSDRGRELIGKIRSGVVKYNAYGCSFVETTYSTAMQGAVNDLGKISSPPGAAPDGESWLLMGLEANKERGESRWTITKTWKSADAGTTWDKELYE